MLLVLHRDLGYRITILNMCTAQEKSKDPKLSTLYVRSVEKAFAVLNAFDGGQRTMSLVEIADKVNMSKSAAQRFTHTLETLGYLIKDSASRRWRLTPRTLEFGTAYLATDSLLEQATTYLIDLNYRTGESVNLSEPDGLDMVFLARYTSHARSFVHMPVGTRIPIYCTASGRAFLSALPDRQMRDYVDASHLHAFTTHTLIDSEAIFDRIADARERGFASAVQEYYLGDLSIAAPILATDGRPLGAVNVSCPTSRWRIEAMVTKIAPFLMETVRQITGGPNARTRQQNNHT